MQTDRLQQADEQQRQFEQARRKNVSRFVEMYLTLGPDAMKLDGTRHDAELAEAKALAAGRWSRLLDLDAQVQREEAALTSRPKNRPAQPGDETLPDRTLAQRDAEWQDKTKYLQAAVADLKEQAKRERKELESFRG